MLGHARLAAQRGTCSRLQVGAVIARRGRPISTGYNGNVSGVAHCHHPIEEVKFLVGQVIVARVEGTGCETAMHAEANAIAFAARHGVATEGADLYVTHQPCLACARLIINAGIWNVFFEHPYRRSEGLDLLLEVGVEVYRPSVVDTSFIQVTK